MNNGDFDTSADPWNVTGGVYERLARSNRGGKSSADEGFSYQSGDAGAKQCAANESGAAGAERRDANQSGDAGAAQCVANESGDAGTEQCGAEETVVCTVGDSGATYEINAAYADRMGAYECGVDGAAPHATADTHGTAHTYGTADTHATANTYGTADPHGTADTYSTATPQPRRIDSKAIASLVLGIVSLLGLPVCGIIGLILGIHSNRDQKSTPATVGIVTSAISVGLLVLCILALIIFLVFAFNHVEILEKIMDAVQVSIDTYA